MILASYADGETGGNAFPGVDTIAAQACVDEKTVRRALTVLKDLGLIHHVSDRTNSNGRPTKVWNLDLAALEATAANPSTQPDDGTGDHHDPGSSETGQPDHRNRAESLTELGGEPTDLPMTSPWNSEAADAVPSFDPFDNPRLTVGDLVLLDEADKNLRYVEGADRGGSNVGRLIEALPDCFTDPARWLAVSLHSKSDEAARSAFVRSLWWDHVVERSEGDDWVEFKSQLLAAEFDEEDAEEVWAKMIRKGVAHPGLALRSLDDDEAYRVMERHLL
ncbi:MAG: Helix-turn-helix domain [Marmoricola sp.]|nr:Helix-turn-helix domain [Marmoricola sp.]